GGMAERQQAGVAEQQIEAERGDRRDQAIGQKLHLIGIDERRQQNKHEQDRRRRRGELARRAVPRRLQIRFHHAVPNKPVGRTSTARGAIKEPTASPGGGKSWLPGEPTKLTTRPPRSAPWRPPTPPTPPTTRGTPTAPPPMPSRPAGVATRLAPPRPAM